MPSDKDKKPLPIATAYPVWLMSLVAPEESKRRYKEAHLHPPAPPTNPAPAPAPLYSHVVNIEDNGTHTLTARPAGPLVPKLSPADQPHTQPPPPQQQQQQQQPQRYRTRAEQDEHDKESIIKFARRLFAEFLGTFIFVFLVAGVALEFNLTNAQVDGLRGLAALDQAGCGWASGLVLTFLVYSIGEISGAHFNPCITWAFTLRGLFPAIWVLPYWTVQFAGSILAGGFLQAFYWHNAHYATTNVNPHYQWVTGFAYEALLTFFFINVILAIATRGGNVGPHAALADGFALAVVVMIGLSYTGTAVNPWRALGPGIVNGQHDNLWVYVAGPFLGSTVSVASAWALTGAIKSEDYESAQGKGEAQPSDDSPEKKKEGEEEKTN